MLSRVNTLCTEGELMYLDRRRG